MPYLKRKMIRGNEYYYLAHNYRCGGKVKTKTLEYIGTQPPSPEQLARMKQKYSTPGTQLTLTL